MSLRLLRLAAGLTASVFALAAPLRDARACGGGSFYPTEDQTISGAVNGHRVVISMSTTQTVLWDQIAFEGNPQDFAWVMPVPVGSSVDIAADAWLEALDATTATRVSSPGLSCPQDDASPACGCSPCSGGAADGNLGNRQSTPDVTIVHEGAVGPYETVTIKSETPGAIGAWLTANGYKIPAAVQPILDEYTAKGMDFIALRLKPAQAVAHMQAVRVTMPGSITTFPMRMLSAGAQETVGLEVFVISEGRVEVSGFPNAEIDPSALTWDFNEHTSNYADVRAKALSASGGKTWLTTYAKQGSLLSEGAAYEVAGQHVWTIADAYFRQGVANQETSTVCTLDRELSESSAKVVDLCAKGSPCATPGAKEIDAAKFACGELKDLSVALTGLHPQSVWLSRFEAKLPREALTTDLTFTPRMSTEVDNRLVAKGGENVPKDCSVPAMAAPGEPSSPTRPPLRGERLAIVISLAGVTATMLRRARRHGPALTPVRA